MAVRTCAITDQYRQGWACVDRPGGSESGTARCPFVSSSRTYLGPGPIAGEKLTPSTTHNRFETMTRGPLSGLKAQVGQPLPARSARIPWMWPAGRKAAVPPCCSPA